MEFLMRYNFMRDPIGDMIRYLEQKKPGDIFYTDDGKFKTWTVKDTMTGKKAFISRETKDLCQESYT